MKYKFILKLGFCLPIFTFVLISPQAKAQSVSWARINSIPTANKIAACPNGRMYILHRDRSITVNRASGRGSDWQNLTLPSGRGSITNILCAGNKLHIVKGADLFQNSGSDESPQWTTIMSRSASTQFGFSLATSGASLGLDGARIPAIFTLLPSTSGISLWQYSNTTAIPWILKGRPIYAQRIAAAGDQWTPLPRIFALNTDKSLWLNSGSGCERVGSAYFWRRIDMPQAAEEITAASVEKIYALNTDKTLWEGGVRRNVTAVSLGERELTLLNLAINGTTISLDRKPRTNNTELKITPSRILSTAGLRENIQDLGELKTPGPLGAKLGVWFTNFRFQRNIQLRLTGNNLEISAPFADGGKVTVNSFIPGNWDIKNAKFTFVFDIVNDTCGLPELKLRSGRFDANLQGDVAGSFIGNFEDIRAQIEAKVNEQIGNFLAEPEVKAALSKLLVDLVPRLPDSGFVNGRSPTAPYTFISGSASISRGRLNYRVEQ
ncbi:hypothetical protein ACWATR_39215 [Nostoc sp. UIC 10890]